MRYLVILCFLAFANMIQAQDVLYPGCEDKACSDKNLQRYIGAHFMYPASLAQTGYKGKIDLTLILNVDGKIQHVAVTNKVRTDIKEGIVETIMKMNNADIAWKIPSDVKKSYTYDYSYPMSVKRSKMAQEMAPTPIMSEELPRFEGCEQIASDIKRVKKCADDKMLRYVYTNLKYPALARERSIQGEVLIDFLVNEDGSVSDPKIIKDIGGGCGEEALKVAQDMIDKGVRWIPGKKNGKVASMRYTLPVKFKLH